MNKIYPLISVIIPAYNAEQFLDETLESVLSQTYENWECIIVNDGSTDNTEEIAKKWCKKDSRFRYFYKENSGASDTRNLGIKEARGEYIALLDADDLYMPNCLEVCLDILVKKEVDLVSPLTLRFEDRPKDIPKCESKWEDILYYNKEGIEPFLGFNKIAIVILCKKPVMEAVGGFTWHKKAEDLHCWLKMLFAGYKLYKVNRYLLHQRIHNQSWSSDERSCAKENFEIVYRFKDEILKLGIDFQYYINHRLREYILLKDKKGNILPNISERMAYVNTILPNFFPEWLIKLPLGEKVRKLIAIQVMNRKIKEI